MSNLSLINVSTWTKEQVITWMKGLDEMLQQYVDKFSENEISGKQILLLDHMDLDSLGITKFGHQELILEAVEHLRQLQESIESETVQSVALKLCCQARCIKSELRSSSSQSDNAKLPLAVVSGTATLVAHIKNFVAWMDRPPFEGSDEYTKKRNDLVKLGMDLIQTVQSEATNNTHRDSIRQLCDTMVRRCEHVMHKSSDALTIQPASLEYATIRKKPEEEFGMHIQSSYNGTHTIGGIKADSPAETCKRIGEGDEVIMVNYQTVIGWELKKLITSLKENPKEVILLLKRRPCHVDPFGTNHRKQKANRLAAQAGTFPGIMRKKSRHSRKGRTPLVELINTTPAETEVYSDGGKEVESENDALDDNVFRSGSESPAFTHQLRAFDDPKQRRATVSGGSPTLKRPSIMISDSDTPRPKSYVLPLHSPGSGESYSFDLSCLDLGSPVSDLISPPADSDGSKSFASQSNQSHKHSSAPSDGKPTSKSPLTSVSSVDSVFTSRTGDKSQLDTTDSSGGALDSSADASFDMTDGREGVASDKPLVLSQKSVPSVSVTDSSESERPKSRAIRDYRRTSSLTAQSTSIRHPSLSKPTFNHPTITETTISPMTPASYSHPKSGSTSSNPQTSPKHTPMTNAEMTDSQRMSGTSLSSGIMSSIRETPKSDEAPGQGSAVSGADRKSTEGMSRTNTPDKSTQSPLRINVTEGVASVQIQPPTPSQESVTVSQQVVHASQEMSSESPSQSSSTSSHSQTPSPDRSRTTSQSHTPSPSPSPGVYGSMGAVPKEISRLSPGRAESPRRRKASEQAAKVIAGGHQEHNTPTLVKVSRIDSMMRAKMAEQERRQRVEGNIPEMPSHPPIPLDDRPLSMVSSYSVNIVGGVPQINRSNHMPRKDSAMTQSQQSLLRKKTGSSARRRIFGGNRRISCKDLGHGDCQGWLLKRKDGSGLGSKWTKHWFVLKEKDMYYYKSPDDERAKGIIHLPGFQIKPAPEVKSKKHVFKAEHSGTTFYFASDRQEDMAKWMNKMGLASIQVETSDNEVIAAFARPDPTLVDIYENPHAQFSESEDDESGSSSPSTITSRSRQHSKEDLSHSHSDDNLEKVFVDIRHKNIEPIRNEDLKRKRVSHLAGNDVRLPNPAQIERLRKLTSLQRTLKDKEGELATLDDVLTSDLSAAVLEQFRKDHTALASSLQSESTSDPSNSEEESGAAAANS